MRIQGHKTGDALPEKKENCTMTTYDDTKTIAIIWSVDDVRTLRPDLSDAQAMDVLRRVESDHDAVHGICWDTLRDAADDMFPAAMTDEWCSHCATEVSIPPPCGGQMPRMRSEHQTVLGVSEHCRQDHFGCCLRRRAFRLLTKEDNHEIQRKSRAFAGAAA